MIQLLFALLALASTTQVANAQATLPQLPNTADLVTCFPDTTGYTRVTVGMAGQTFSNLQQAINQVELGTVIILDAGATYNGSFSLPNKTAGKGWVIIVGSAQDRLPEQGERSDPTAFVKDGKGLIQAQFMPKIITTNVSGVPCFTTQTRAHHYRLVGLEVSVAEYVPESYGLINLGDGSNSQKSLEVVPHHLIIDRCYIHGNVTGNIMKYGVRLDCAYGAVIDSYISGFHSVGFDAQAISGINGPGPFKIINNFLEASGENIMFGGGAASIPELVPSDIEIRQNYFFKPLSWNVKHPTYAGKHWTIKNLFELKTGKRVLLDGNVLENCWADLPVGQSGYGILLTIRTEGGGSPQADVSDITISNNIIRHVAAGIAISGSDDGKGIRSSRINVYNNLFDDVDGTAYGDGNNAGPNVGTFAKIGEPTDLTFNHNTVFQNGAVTWAYGIANGFSFINNLVNAPVSPGGYQGVYGPGKTQGNTTISGFFPDLTDASLRFNKNVFIGTDQTKYTNFSTLSKNYFPKSVQDVAFVNYSEGQTDYHNYELQPQSPFSKMAADGKDIGVDYVQLDSALTKKRECTPVTSVTAASLGNADTKVFPLPARNEVRITGSQSFSGAAIYSLQGEEAMKTSFGAVQEFQTVYTYTINVEGIPAGAYILLLVDQEEIQRRLIIVER